MSSTFTTAAIAGQPAYDDENSDYIVTPGEEILDRYIVRGRIGKGSFGQVLRAFDKITSIDVALKMIKSKRPFRNQANTEIDILIALRDSDEMNRHHIGSSHFLFVLKAWIISLQL